MAGRAGDGDRQRADRGRLVDQHQRPRRLRQGDRAHFEHLYPFALPAEPRDAPGLGRRPSGCASRSWSGRSLRAILAPLEDAYDFIVFDTPPAINYLTINALAAADELLIPAAASTYSEGGVQQTLKEFERATQSYNPGLKLRGVLVTRLKHTNAATAVLDGITEAYPDSLMKTVIFESTAVDEAEQVGEPVVTYAPGTPAALGYKHVAKLFIEEEVV